MRNGVMAEMAATSAITLCMEIPKTAATTTYMTADWDKTLRAVRNSERNAAFIGFLLSK